MQVSEEQYLQDCKAIIHEIYSLIKVNELGIPKLEDSVVLVKVINMVESEHSTRALTDIFMGT